ncbi:unnamed protein product, partial [Thlaspi arvense]
WLTKRNKKALCEALEKIKSELMLLGFISLLLTVTQGLISEICVPKSVAASWHPCNKKQEEKKYGGDEDLDTGEYYDRRKLLSFLGSGESHRRALAAKDYDNCAKEARKGSVGFQLWYPPAPHFHFYMRKWKAWEKETKTAEYQYTHDPERFRFTRETSFGRRHLNFWSHSSFLLWISCFFRQFVRSVAKVDYLTLRHGFIAPYNLAFCSGVPTVQHPWMALLPLATLRPPDCKHYFHIIILLVGTKLQVIITKMGLRIQKQGEVIKGVPVVRPGDELFWFNRPRLLLYLIHFVLFQVSFSLSEINPPVMNLAYILVFMKSGRHSHQSNNRGPSTNNLQLRDSPTLCLGHPGERF